MTFIYYQELFYYYVNAMPYIILNIIHVNFKQFINVHTIEEIDRADGRIKRLYRFMKKVANPIEEWKLFVI